MVTIFEKLVLPEEKPNSQGIINIPPQSLKIKNMFPYCTKLSEILRKS